MGAPLRTTVASVLVLCCRLAWADGPATTPYESLPWLKLGTARQSDVVQALGEPTVVVDEARFRSTVFDRRSEYSSRGLVFWYLFDDDRDPKVNQVLVTSAFKGQSSLGIDIG